jgi:hypothetical protein
MNEELMLEITQRHQCELRQLAQAMRVNPDPIDALDCGVDVPSTLGSRLRNAWEATLRPLRAQL